MSETVTTDIPSFYDDTTSLFPLEEYDSIQGVYDDVKYSVTYTPCDKEELVSIWGEYKIKVFKPDSDPLSDGGVVFYTELHREPSGETSPLRYLFRRAEGLAREVSNREDIIECPYCGFMASTDNRISRNFSMISDRGRWIPGLDTEDDVCAGLSSWIPPQVEVYSHPEENLFYDQDELEACESLVRTTGYPSWSTDAHLTSHTYFYLRTLLEENPEVFDEELDVDTITAVLDRLDKSSGPKELLVDQRKFTSKEP